MARGSLCSLLVETWSDAAYATFPGNLPLVHRFALLRAVHPDRPGLGAASEVSRPPAWQVCQADVVVWRPERERVVRHLPSESSPNATTVLTFFARQTSPCSSSFFFRLPFAVALFGRTSSAPAANVASTSHSLTSTSLPPKANLVDSGPADASASSGDAILRLVDSPDRR